LIHEIVLCCWPLEMLMPSKKESESMLQVKKRTLYKFVAWIHGNKNSILCKCSQSKWSFVVDIVWASKKHNP
jgi:hypothetical protein